MKGKYLITCDAYFIAPDGKQYKSVWGEAQILPDDFLGLKTNSRSTNWYVKVGCDDNHVIVAGCQMHYAIKCDKKPNTDSCLDWYADGATGFQSYKRPSLIYIADESIKPT
jgi:hypothetical protein